MSSEMRVTDAMVTAALDAQPLTDENESWRVWQIIGFDNARAEKIMRSALNAALLARTEAGADGAVAPADLARWLTEKLLSFDENRYRRELDTLHLRMAFAALPPLYTHPQDASGDAERYRVLRRALADPMFTSDALADAISGRNAKVIDAVVDAMQAKEAK